MVALCASRSHLPAASAAFQSFRFQCTKKYFSRVMGAGSSIAGPAIRLDPIFLEDFGECCSITRYVEPLQRNALDDWFKQLGERGIFVNRLTKKVTLCRCGVSIEVTLMALACYEGEISVCKFLLENNGDDVLTPTLLGGFTPVMLASIRGHIHILKWLFENGADEDLRTMSADGFTALMCAWMLSRFTS
jgi:hypothetical protein